MVTEGVLDFLALESKLFNSPIHGVYHWRTVERNGLYLAQFTKADPAVISFFAYFHDCKRENEYEDPEHGPRAAAFLKQHRLKISLNDEQFKLLCIACSGHTFGRKVSHPTIATCWDADRLDISRVGVRRDPQYFFCPEAIRIVNERDDKALHQLVRRELCG